MKPSRWRSRIFSGLALFSLVVFVAAVAMEVRGYFATDVFCRSHGSSYEVLGCMRGFTICEHVEGIPSQHLPFYSSFKPQDLSVMSNGSTSISFLGNRFIKEQNHNVTIWIWACPLWQVMIVSFPLAGLFVRRTIFRRRQTKPGHCPECGYDLRASPERCPECGRPSTAL
jgi:hypothetical protein